MCIRLAPAQNVNFFESWKMGHKLVKDYGTQQKLLFFGNVGKKILV